MASTAAQGDPTTTSLLSPTADTPRVRFEPSNANDEDEQARLRRGSVSKDLRNQIALRGIIGRNAVSQGYSTVRSFSRSQSEASIFRPDPKPELEPPAVEGALDNPSNTLWKSRYTQLSRVKSTSSVISGLNDDVLRAGWRRNEPGPLWEQSRELDCDRQAITNIPEVDEGDGFDVEEMELDADSSPAISSDFVSLNQSEDTNESADQFGALPASKFSFSHPNPSTVKRQFGKIKSMPVGGTFGTRPDQEKFHREFDSTFMRMDMEF
ncbi:hypothetical protein PGT21_011018 [Puccinia graminis f. sp. tritici]|uniref:Uncharacterized protein n=2 Tax=Puccinia graminis f. sp. tritici TaxID=56615 RepID=E3K9R9_PUCGT|nr:uncharacterized protein PGTG_07392 [Puccinia graminis f. sp. tritici CRL 75-36-700-3]EFP81140.1 hypothetical protein PGTG_07392 [Puccinia graminis f. sp. tritici CRL 75-36-700-3]KAA1069079.1 hypothetical protein PGT21_011018 [Puccinia graminis f. sp. tritici]